MIVGGPLLAQNQITGRAALVTGVGRGLGRAMTSALLRAGHRVFLTATDTTSLEETRRVSEGDDRAALATADLANEQNLSAVVDAAIETFGRVDILINNAGIPNPPATQTLDISSDQIRRLLEVNTFAPIELTRLVMPGMVQHGWGRVIFISKRKTRVRHHQELAFAVSHRRCPRELAPRGAIQMSRSLPG
jgi:NAD(P)-dependent dehydrogenase (short-subunit alcohol dehydrogenase family)